MKTVILYIGRNAEITTVMDRLLNAKPEWKGITTCKDEEAEIICKQEKVDLVLLGNGIDDACEKALRTKLLAINADVKIIQHYGGGSGLLYGEIAEALNTL